MNKAYEVVLSYISIIFGLFGVSISTGEIEQILSIVVLCISIVSSIVLWILRIVTKIKAAKEDGKITAEEIEDITKEVESAVTDITKQIGDAKAKGDGGSNDSNTNKED